MTTFVRLLTIQEVRPLWFHRLASTKCHTPYIFPFGIGTQRFFKIQSTFLQGVHNLSNYQPPLTLLLDCVGYPLSFVIGMIWYVVIWYHPEDKLTSVTHQFVCPTHSWSRNSTFRMKSPLKGEDETCLVTRFHGGGLIDGHPFHLVTKVYLRPQAADISIVKELT